MDLIRTNYISAVVEDQLATLGGVARLIQQAERRNPVLGITGALIFTGSHFAQTLEGSPGVVGGLMEQIRCDPRHHVLLEFGHDRIKTRRFSIWAVAYVGPSVYIARTVAKVLSDAPRHPGPAIDELLNLLSEFNK